MIPKKPHGSVITESHDPDGLTLSWPMPSAGLREYGSGLLMLGLGAYLVYLNLGLFMRPGPGGFQWTMLLYLMVPLVLVVVPSLRLLRGSRPESITLGVDTFRHNLGRATGYMGYADTFRHKDLDRRSVAEKYLGPPLVVEAAREDVRRVVLERDNGLKLRYDLGADRVEIGRYLREPEKEWLVEVIKEWQGSP